MPQIRTLAIIAYLIWKGSYDKVVRSFADRIIIAYLIWKGSYNRIRHLFSQMSIIAYLIWKERYNKIIKLVITNIFNFYRNLL